MKDGLWVAKRIGLKYLWVDSYCIDQDNTEEKRRLIGQMDRVFEGALITVCAVSEGGDPPGIYGVSVPMQRQHQVVRECIKGTFKTVAIPRFTSKLSRSLWNWRAWTMEEAVLSRRCILFLKTQTALWCNSHVFHDAFSWSDAPATITSPDAYGVTAGSLAFTLEIPEEGSLWDYEAWSQILTVYTGRQLTKEKDAMRALSGLRHRVCTNTCTPLPFGLPLSKSVCGLLWKVRAGTSCERRDGFPSWSWLGWCAQVEFDHWLEVFRGDHNDGTYLLGIPKKRHSLWGRREFGTDSVYLRFEAKILFLPPEDFEPGNTKPLQLKSLSAQFEVQWIQEEGAWRLLDREGVAVPIIKGYNITGLSLHLVLPKDIPNFNPKRLEFICIQHWKEAAPLSTKFGEVVTTIAVTRDGSNGKATRVGSVAIPYKSWEAASPQRVVVDII